jgi:hypothetical protein
LHMCRYISLAMMYRYQQKSLPWFGFKTASYNFVPSPQSNKKKKSVYKTSMFIHLNEF